MPIAYGFHGEKITSSPFQLLHLFRSLAHRLAKTPELLRTYGAIIKEQEQQGFIERVESNSHSHNVHYIPHHPVRKGSATTPI